MGEVRNIRFEQKGDRLIIEVDVSSSAIKQAPWSSTGKSKLVASSGGFMKVGDNMALNLNLSVK
jgi:hypothetical protein